MKTMSIRPYQEHYPDIHTSVMVDDQAGYIIFLPGDPLILLGKN